VRCGKALEGDMRRQARRGAGTHEKEACGGKRSVHLCPAFRF
jgi:hypothetical protein